MNRRPLILAVVLLAFLINTMNAGAAGPAPADGRTALASPQSFSSIKDPQQRSAAYFTELSKVLTHARCVNCHPSSASPRQGDTRRLHQPPVVGGADGFGVGGMRCNSCHQDTNFNPGRMPGHAHWHLAPREMGWEGKTVAEICAQIKDPKRNGNRSLNELVKHIGEDSLVGWAWEPGFGREPAPGTQQEAGALAKAWVDSGASCPASSSAGLVVKDH
jgi:hypothetical protein